jgi:hypothetical protein
MGLRESGIRLDHGIYICEGLRRAGTDLDVAGDSPESPHGLLRLETNRPTFSPSGTARMTMRRSLLALLVLPSAVPIAQTAQPRAQGRLDDALEITGQQGRNGKGDGVSPLCIRKTCLERAGGFLLHVIWSAYRRKSKRKPCQNCVRYPPKPRSRSEIYRSAAMRIVVAASR